jgi:hypothetical protein
MTIANQSDSPARVPMSKVIQFRRRDTAQDEAPDIDLLTAVDVAIRDLQDISQGCGASVCEQVMQCRQMLERAFNAAVQSPRQTREIALMTSSPISLQARYAATRSAPPGGTRSKGSRILTIVPVPSDADGTIVPPS